VEAILNQIHARQHTEPPLVYEVSPAALAAMKEHHWPGGLRELHKVLSRAVAGRRTRRRITHSAIREALTYYGRLAVFEDNGALPDTKPARYQSTKTLDEERRDIVAALRAVKGHRRAAADRLGMVYRTLLRKMTKHQIRHQEFMVWSIMASWPMSSIVA
jgi:DNA-binding NtrC family response regulator